MVEEPVSVLSELQSTPSHRVDQAHVTKTALLEPPEHTDLLPEVYCVSLKKGKECKGYLCWLRRCIAGYAMI